MKYVTKNMDKLLQIPLRKASACYTFDFDEIIDVATSWISQTIHPPD